MMTLIWTIFVWLVLLGLALIAKAISLTRQNIHSVELFIDGWANWWIGLYGVSGGGLLFLSTYLPYHRGLYPFDVMVAVIGGTVAVFFFLVFLYGTKLGDMILDALNDDL